MQISYGDDPEQAMEIMVKSAFANGRVLQDPDKSMQVVANAKQRVARRFSWEASKAPWPLKRAAPTASSRCWTS